jgi:hypothetical protein
MAAKLLSGFNTILGKFYPPFFSEIPSSAKATPNQTYDVLSNFCISKPPLPYPKPSPSPHHFYFWRQLSLEEIKIITDGIKVNLQYCFMRFLPPKGIFFKLKKSVLHHQNRFCY